MKKKSSLLDIIGTIQKFWPLLLCLAGIIGTLVTIPSRLAAAEKEIIDIKEYTKAERENKKSQEDAIKNAPPGWQWNLTTQTYLEWKEDPRLRKK